MKIKQTKIICTIGPASENKKAMLEMVKVGMDVMRLNFSHGTYDEALNKVNILNEINKELEKNVAVMLDTKGPEIRTHKFKNDGCNIEKGTEVFIHMDEIIGDKNNFSVTYPDLIKDVYVDGDILVDDGYLTLKIKNIDKEKRIISTIALNSHFVSHRRGINVPNADVKTKFLSKKDREDILWGVENNVSFIAASFVRRVEDVKAIRNLLNLTNNKRIKIISKIENQTAVNNIDSIIDESDGIMIARGDLGVEVPYEEVPVIQKYIISRCQAKGKIVVTATQMLESMQNNPHPTRAEVSDVANAILDGTDAIMLSGETAAGKYPIESVDVMSNIARRTEEEIDRSTMIKRASKESEKCIETSIALSVAYTAKQGDVDLIITPTVSGETASLISKYRPQVPILALTFNEKVAKCLSLNNGVIPLMFNLKENTEEVIEEAVEISKTIFNLKPGMRIVVTAGFPIGSSTNTMRIIKV